MPSINFFIPMKAMPKERPRFVRLGKFIRTYTPNKTQHYEKKVRDVYLAYTKDRLLGPIEANMTVIFEPPKSLSKKKRLALLDQPCTNKKSGDIDNLDKAILDSLNGTAYEDDASVYSIISKKVYGTREGTYVTLKDNTIVKPFTFEGGYSETL